MGPTAAPSSNAQCRNTAAWPTFWPVGHTAVFKVPGYLIINPYHSSYEPQVILAKAALLGRF